MTKLFFIVIFGVFLFISTLFSTSDNPVYATGNNAVVCSITNGRELLSTKFSVDNVESVLFVGFDNVNTYCSEVLFDGLLSSNYSTDLEISSYQRLLFTQDKASSINNLLLDGNTRVVDVLRNWSVDSQNTYDIWDSLTTAQIIARMKIQTLRDAKFYARFADLLNSVGY